MELINAPLRVFFDAVLAPFAGRSPMLTLVPISVVVGIVALLLFKWTSNQSALEAARRRQIAGFFEIRLFNDDLRSLLAAQGRILRATGRFLLYTLVPLVVLLVVLLPVIGQLHFRYAYTGLEPGDSVLLKVKLAAVPGDRGERPAATLSAPSGVQVETPAVWIPAEHTLAWRLRAAEHGDHTLELDLGGETVTKTVTVSDRIVRRSPVRPGRSLGAQLLYPAARPLPREGPVESIELLYPSTQVNLLGWRTHWMVAFLLLTIVAGLVLRGPLKVTI